MLSFRVGVRANFNFCSLAPEASGVAQTTCTGTCLPQAPSYGCDGNGQIVPYPAGVGACTSLSTTTCKCYRLVNSACAPAPANASQTLTGLYSTLLTCQAAIPPPPVYQNTFAYYTSSVRCPPDYYAPKGIAANYWTCGSNCPGGVSAGYVDVNCNCVCKPSSSLPGNAVLEMLYSLVVTATSQATTSTYSALFFDKITPKSCTQITISAFSWSISGSIPINATIYLGFFVPSSSKFIMITSTSATYVRPTNTYTFYYTTAGTIPNLSINETIYFITYWQTASQAYISTASLQNLTLTFS